MMIDCHNAKKLIYKKHFIKLDLSVLKGLLEQYKWEQNNDLEWNGTQIEVLEEVIRHKNK